MLAIITVQSKLWPTEWCLSNTRKCLLALIVSNIKSLWTFCFALLLRHDLKRSCSPGWHWVCYVATDNFGCLRLQPLPPKCETARKATIPRLWSPEILSATHTLLTEQHFQPSWGIFIRHYCVFGTEAPEHEYVPYPQGKPGRVISLASDPFRPYSPPHFIAKSLGNSSKLASAPLSQFTAKKVTHHLTTPSLRTLEMPCSLDSEAIIIADSVFLSALSPGPVTSAQPNPPPWFTDFSDLHLWRSAMDLWSQFPTGYFYSVCEHFGLNLQPLLP